MGPLRLHSVVSRDHARLASALLFASFLFASLLGAPPFARAGAEFDSTRAVSTADTAQAAEPRYRLEPTVVTAERLPVAMERVPADIQVLGRRELERHARLFLAEELREIPAIDVQRSGSLGKLTDVRLRGADPRHTLVLFDGIPLNGPWTGAFDFSDLPGTGWGRVEVVGGPTSALYGSGAVGGVIQILSPERGAAPAFRALAEYGEHQTLRQSAEWNGRLRDLEMAAFANRLTSEGIGPRDGYTGLAARLHSRFAIDHDELAASILASHGTKEIPYDYRFDLSDFSMHQVADPNAEETDDLMAARIAHTRRLGAKVLYEGEVSAMGARIHFRNPADAGTTDFVDAKLDNASLLLGSRARIEPAGPVRGVTGFELRWDSVNRDDDSQYGGVPSQSLVIQSAFFVSAYSEAHLELPRLLLDAGVRVDHHSRYGSMGVPRVALGVPFPEAGIKLRGGYGRAFSAPTLTDLYYPLYGSTTLRPERSRTWEAGFDGSWLGGRVGAGSTWHTTRFKDLIQSNSYYVADNIGRARIEGAETWVRVAPLKQVVLSGRAARLIAKNLDGGARLPKRPRWRAGVTMDVEAGGIGGTASLRWVDSMPDPFAFYDVSGRYLSGDTPGYASLDLGARASFERWAPLEMRLRLLNALDRAYSEVRGYPALGRTATISLAFLR